MRRAGDSMTAAISEGWVKRASELEFKRYLRIALGPANEMESHLDAAMDVGFMKQHAARALNETYRVIGAQLVRLIENWRTFPVPSSNVHGPPSDRKGAT
jgi:four helix bundle protein